MANNFFDENGNIILFKRRKRLSFNEVNHLVTKSFKSQLRIVLERRPKITLSAISKELGLSEDITDTLLRNLSKIFFHIDGYYDEIEKTFFQETTNKQRRSPAWIYASLLIDNLGGSEKEYSWQEIYEFLADNIGRCNRKYVNQALYLLKTRDMVFSPSPGSYIFNKTIE